MSCINATGFLANVGKCHAVLEGLCEQHAVNIINLQQTAVRVCLRNVFSAQILDVRNVLVVVSRWYGGILLGPDRFKHISNCARSILIQEAYTDTSVRIRTNSALVVRCPRSAISAEGGGVRYDDVWSWTIKMSPRSAFLKKYRSIVLQRTIYLSAVALAPPAVSIYCTAPHTFTAVLPQR